MTDVQSDCIYLASLGLGKVFDRPLVGVIAKGKENKSWYEGDTLSFSLWIQTLPTSLDSLFFSYEIDLALLQKTSFASSVSFTFYSPHATVPGQTVAWLKRQGHHVTLIENPLAIELNHVVYATQRNDIPFIAQSFGMSLDGKIATYTGDSKYISGPEVLQAIHRLRHRYQAIMVGISTVLLDHPKLTTRLRDIQGHSPIRIILDTHLRIALDEPLLSIQEGATWIVTSIDVNESKMHAIKSKGAKIIQVPLKGDHLDLALVLKTIKLHGIHSVLVEGGATLHGSFLDQGFSHRVYASISPLFIGGKEAKSPIAGQGFKTLSESLKLAFINIETFGEDILLTATIKGKKT